MVDVKAIQQNLDAVKAKREQNNNAIGKNQGNISTNEADISQNKNDIAGNASAVDANNSAIESTKSSIASVESELSSISGKKSGVQESIQGLKAKLDNPDIDDATRNQIEGDIKSQEMSFADFEKMEADLTRQKTELENKKAEQEQQGAQLKAEGEQFAQKGVDLSQTQTQLKDEATSLEQIASDLAAEEQQVQTELEEAKRTETTVQYGDTFDKLAKKQLEAMKATNPNATLEDAKKTLIANNSGTINEKNLNNIKIGKKIVFEGEVDVSGDKSVAENAKKYSTLMAKKQAEAEATVANDRSTATLTNTDTKTDYSKMSDNELFAQEIANKQKSNQTAKNAMEDYAKNSSWLDKVVDEGADIYKKGINLAIKHFTGGYADANDVYEKTGLEIFNNTETRNYEDAINANIAKNSKVVDNISKDIDSNPNKAINSYTAVTGKEFNRDNFIASAEARDTFEDVKAAVDVAKFVDNSVANIEKASTKNVTAGFNPNGSPIYTEINDYNQKEKDYKEFLNNTLNISDNEIKLYAQAKGVNYDSLDNEGKSNLYRNISRDVSTNAHTIANEKLNGKSLDEYRKDYVDADKKVWGNNSTISNLKVEDFKTSQEHSKLAVKAAVAITTTAVTFGTGAVAGVAITAGTNAAMTILDTGGTKDGVNWASVGVGLATDIASGGLSNTTKLAKGARMLASGGVDVAGGALNSYISGDSAEQGVFDAALSAAGLGRYGKKLNKIIDSSLGNVLLNGSSTAAKTALSQHLQAQGIKPTDSELDKIIEYYKTNK